MSVGQIRLFIYDFINAVCYIQRKTSEETILKKPNTVVNSALGQLNYPRRSLLVVFTRSYLFPPLFPPSSIQNIFQLRRFILITHSWIGAYSHLFSSIIQTIHDSQFTTVLEFLDCFIYTRAYFRRL